MNKNNMKHYELNIMYKETDDLLYISKEKGRNQVSVTI